MKNTLKFCIYAILLTTVNSLFGEGISATTKLALESNYVSYGTRFSKATISPMLDISKGSYFAGVWGYLPEKPNKSFEGEWDFFAGKTAKINNLLSFDIGATIYKYPRADVDPVTLEPFLYVSFSTPAKPKLKLFYDVVVKSWIGESEVSHTFKLTDIVGLTFEGRFGFRRPETHSAWYYTTAKADIVFTLNQNTVISVGGRVTNNTNHTMVGHGLLNWYGVSIARSW
jgi:hypothetical protein